MVKITEIFYMFLNMSITASFAIVLVFLLRLLLKGAPRVFPYILWIVVFARLLCPFVPEADWGIVPGIKLAGVWDKSEIREKGASGINTEEYLSGEGMFSGALMEEGGKKAQEKDAGESDIQGSGLKEQDLEASAAALIFLIGRKAAQGFAVIWLAVCMGLILYGAVSYWHFMNSLKAGRVKALEKEMQPGADGGDKKYLSIISEDIKAPFVAGFFKPVIYLPSELTGTQLTMVAAHEKMHISRRDYLIKPVAYLAACIHWFNPFVWLAFHFMENDMEISCDEAVLRKIGYEKNKDYARTLLYLSREHGWNPGCPIAFGENSVKTRIKNAVRCKNTKSWIVVVSAMVVLTAAVLLLTNSKWRLVISLKEKGAAKEITAGNHTMDDLVIDSVEDSLTAAQGVPGTDSNADEVVYLPAEKIEHVETVPGNETSNTVTDHYYTQAQEKEDQGKISDNYLILLRQAQGPHNDLAIEYIYPLDYERISDDYGVRIHPATQAEKVHSGIDFAAEKGTPVKASAAGVVFETGNDIACGNYVIIQHGNGDMTYYANCDEIVVKAGQNVDAGEQIATVGNTGQSTGAHLHYALSRNNEYVRPEFAD